MPPDIVVSGLRFYCDSFIYLSILLCLCHRWRHTVFGSVRPSVSAWMNLCVPKTLWTPYLKMQWREFHPILITHILWLIDVLIRFWGQKVKGQGHSRRSHNRRRKPGEFHLVFVSYPPSSLNGTQPRSATCSNVSAVWKCMSWSIPSRTNLGPKTHLFGRFCNLTATSTAYIFGTKHDMHNR